MPSTQPISVPPSSNLRIGLSHGLSTMKSVPPVAVTQLIPAPADVLEIEAVFCSALAVSNRNTFWPPEKLLSATSTCPSALTASPTAKPN